MLSIERFKESWEGLRPKGQNLALLAVSGGADSMVMAVLFKMADLPFVVGHCNFGLRGEASDGDEQFVRQWCEDNDIPFHTVRFDTKTFSKEEKRGTQEAARVLRYRWLDEIRSQHQYTTICTAHHRDDNAETVLMNLARGTGIAGLHGILPRQGSIIRPLLSASRKEIEEFALANDIAFRTDASNNTDDYTRNALRHRVLPILEEIMPGAAARIHETAQRIGEAEMLYRKVIGAERRKLLQARGKDYYIPVKLLRNRQPLNTIVYELIQPFGFGAAQVRDVVQLLTAESGRYTSSTSHRIIRSRDFLIITTVATATADFLTIDALPAEIETPEGVLYCGESAVPDRIDAGVDICYLDYKKIEQPLVLRRWKIGDYFYPLGMGGKKKKLSRFFIDQKVPLHEKEHIWVLESNKRIAWVCGMRMDDRFKISSSTNSVLKVRFVKL